MGKLIITAAIALLASTAFASDQDKTEATLSVTEVQQAQEQLCSAELSMQELEQRGCCSWHGGVCGCSLGTVVCCDGTFSPSCTCLKDGEIFK